MKVKPFQISVFLWQAIITLVVMWACISFFAFAIASTCYAPIAFASTMQLGIVIAIGNALPIMGLPSLLMLRAMTNELWKTIAAQQTQIDDLKRELESRKQ